MNTPVRISIIIPTLQEEALISRTLAQFTPELRRRYAMEIIVSDGGSTDRTTGLACPAADRVVCAEPGIRQTISGGRLLLGIGAGGSRRTPYAVEQAAIGQTVERDAVRAQRVVDAIALIRRLWAGESGFLRPEPTPPIIVGGFGPRMAGIAGRHGDGFNTQAFHPQLAELARTARDAHAASGRASSFTMTVFAGLEDRWLRAESRARQLVERAGVDRLILLVSPPFDADEIRQAGRLLTPAR